LHIGSWVMILRAFRGRIVDGKSRVLRREVFWCESSVNALDTGSLARKSNCNANCRIKRCHKCATKFSDQPQVCLTFHLWMNQSYLIPMIATDAHPCID
jgi:hypothetical protein